MRLQVSLGIMTLVASLMVAGCAAATPAPSPTKAASPPQAAPVPTKAASAASPTAEPTKSSVPPTSAVVPPTPVPAKKTTYPEKGKSITLINPWPAGGSTDIAARLLAPPLEQELGVPIQIVSKPGAGGQIGTVDLVRSKPDGYTIAVALNMAVITGYLDPESEAAYGRKDFDLVCHQVSVPQAIAVAADSPYKSLKDIVDAAKANPGKIKVTASGVLNDTHLVTLMLQKVANVEFAIVQFAGGPPASTAVMGGHIDATVQSLGALAPHLKSGALRLIGVFDKERIKAYPDVKTAREEGYDVNLASTRGFIVPAGTPKDVIDILANAIKKSMVAGDVNKKMEDAGMPQLYLGPAEFNSYWSQLEAQLEPLVKDARAEINKK